MWYAPVCVCSDALEMVASRRRSEEQPRAVVWVTRESGSSRSVFEDCGLQDTACRLRFSAANVWVLVLDCLHDGLRGLEDTQLGDRFWVADLFCLAGSAHERVLRESVRSGCRSVGSDEQFDVDSFLGIRFRFHNGVRFKTHMVFDMWSARGSCNRLRTVDKARAEVRCPAGCLSAYGVIGQGTNVVPSQSRFRSRVT